ncbi:MAG: molybdopterin-dependent oxidoreductase [Hyphomicrobiaceae bacterium]|nr:molybdopterin-dependent oxidoreductase [Hyphomicrobiaceae bacterium]
MGTRTEPGRSVRTTCPYCGVGCGVRATAISGERAEVAGDAAHPANLGRLCSKGAALGETLGSATRLKHPVIGGRTASWTEALDHVAEGLKRVAAAHGPEAIAFYLSGQLLTEDYYVANKLAKGFIGTPHVDTNSRLCMSSTVAGHRRAFGADVVPQAYEDLELADVVVLVGSNAAWCHPVLFQRLQKARAERGLKIVNIDPRRTDTSEGADMHIALKAGTDAHLWNGLLAWLADYEAFDWDYVNAHTQGLAEALAAARMSAGLVSQVAAATGLEAAEIEAFYALWAGTGKVVTCFSQGVNQSVAGTDKVNAILNCHLATGRIGKPGSGPLSLTGQPNAMGGREVGGLANMLAAHMGFSEGERDTVRRFWHAPRLVAGEGLKAVAMFEAIAHGRIKALWVMGTNPAVSLPDADRVRAALGKLELLVVSDTVASNDTIGQAHVLLPAHAWGEKNGTVTNSERRISRQRPFLAPVGEARPDWWIMSQVAQRLGWGKAFAYRTPAAIFREHAVLSGFENGGQRAFDISGLGRLTAAQYDALEPVQWPVREPGAGTQRLFAEGQFPTPNGRARLVAIKPPAPAEAQRTAARPFTLNTGRVRDQWHTMTRTGLAPRLALHSPEPYVEMHASDAARLGIADGHLARVETALGSAVLRVRVSAGQQPGSLFAPIHWSGENSSQGRIGALVHAVTDPYSGQPDAKATPAAVQAFACAAHGVLLTRHAPALDGAAYWAQARMPQGFVTFLGLDRDPAGVQAWSECALGPGQRLALVDEAKGRIRMAVLDGGRLEAMLFLAPEPEALPLEWLKSCFDRDAIAPADRLALLAGRSATRMDEGPTVCACFQVGRQRIARCIAGGAQTTQAIGAALKAGTNCGSCLPELKRMLASTPGPEPMAPVKIAAE